MACVSHSATLGASGTGFAVTAKAANEGQVRAVVACSHAPFQRFSGLASGHPFKRERPSLQQCRRLQKPTRGAIVAQASATAQQSKHGANSVIGTARKEMEDAYSVEVDNRSGISFYAVYDGHGGKAVAEFLQQNMWNTYKTLLAELDPRKATEKAYAQVDSMVVAPKKGFFGAMMERGLGGSRCGACAATAVVLPREGGARMLVAANVGDSRVLLGRNGETLQLSVDHKPNIEAERQRIEAKNPTPGKPLVVNVDGTWRVGGLLALSRAFGDVYLKDWEKGEASGGFGLTAEPDVVIEKLTADDDWLVLATDGLTESVPNEEILSTIRAAGSDADLSQVAKKLVRLAQERGSSDDVTLVIVPLQ